MLSVSKTNVSLQLLKGENDAQLRWPTDSTLTLGISVSSGTSASSRTSTTAPKGQGRGAGYRQKSAPIGQRRRHQLYHQGYAAYTSSQPRNLWGRDRDMVQDYGLDDDHSDQDDHYDDHGDYNYHYEDRNPKPQKTNYLSLSLNLNQYLQQRIVRENARELTHGSIESQGPWIVKLSLTEPRKAVDLWSHKQQERDDDYYD